MNIAQKIEQSYSGTNRLESGMFEENPLEYLQNQKVNYSIVSNNCPESWDGEITIKFADGSRADIGNPTQGAFAGFFRA